mmetsp:Transcript_93967/g.262403  ORF Transcript_93967/g.262403 Transcript_93967/m.262403 type:complete len:362 (+) Transcript_93967:997-2082(+)
MLQSLPVDHRVEALLSECQQALVLLDLCVLLGQPLLQQLLVTLLLFPDGRRQLGLHVLNGLERTSPGRIQHHEPLRLELQLLPVEVLELLCSLGVRRLHLVHDPLALPLLRLGRQLQRRAAPGQLRDLRLVLRPGTAEEDVALVLQLLLLAHLPGPQGGVRGPQLVAPVLQLLDVRPVDEHDVRAGHALCARRLHVPGPLLAAVPLHEAVDVEHEDRAVLPGGHERAPVRREAGRQAPAGVEAQGGGRVRRRARQAREHAARGGGHEGGAAARVLADGARPQVLAEPPLLGHGPVLEAPHDAPAALEARAGHRAPRARGGGLVLAGGVGVLAQALPVLGVPLHQHAAGVAAPQRVVLWVEA